jgi:hypothetical protein
MRSEEAIADVDVIVYVYDYVYEPDFLHAESLSSPDPEGTLSRVDLTDRSQVERTARSRSGPFS